MFPSASENSVLEFVVPKLMSPRFGITLAVVGECELKCSKCNLVPLQFAQLDCGHKFCSSCLVESVGLIDGKFVCPVCGKGSLNIGYHKSDLARVKKIADIHCPHCAQVFPTIQDFVVHERQNPDYFQLETFQSMASKIYQSQMNFSAFDVDEDHAEKPRRPQSKKDQARKDTDDDTPRTLQRGMIILFSLLVVVMASLMTLRYVQTKPSRRVGLVYAQNSNESSLSAGNARNASNVQPPTFTNNTVQNNSPAKPLVHKPGATPQQADPARQPEKAVNTESKKTTNESSSANELAKPSNKTIK